MRLIEAIIAIAGLGLLSGASVKLITSGLRQRRISRGVWHVATYSQKDGFIVAVERPGEVPVERWLPKNASSEDLVEAQLEAEDQACALNQNRGKK